MVNPTTGEEIAVNEDTIISNGLRADVMRNKMENKDALQNEGDIYIGTGEKTTIEADGKTYEIPKTIGMNLIDALQVYGAITSFPLSEALNPYTLSNKEELVKTDGTLTDRAKKSFAYTVGGTDIELQAKDESQGKEEIIIPAWSKGMVLSSGADLLVTYGDAVISGSFFYSQSQNPKKWTMVKVNIASILDSETMKTTNDGLIPKTSGSVNLGSSDNEFKNIYTKYYTIDYKSDDVGSSNSTAAIRFRYNAQPPAEGGNKVNIDVGRNIVDPNGNTVTIKSYSFCDGSVTGDNRPDYAWIASKGIVPYLNNEVNFDLYYPEGTVDPNSDITFGYRDSSKKIENYAFWNGQGSPGDRAGIKCGKINYYSYYNPDGAPLENATAQDISENIKSINKRLSDLGFKQAYLVEASSSGTLPEGTRLGTLERWGNVVLIKLDYNFATLDLGRVVKPDGDSEWKSSWFNPESFNNDGTGTILLFEAQVKDTTGSGTTILRLKVTRAYSDSYLSLSLDSVPAATGLSNSITEGSVFAYKAKPIS